MSIARKKGESVLDWQVRICLNRQLYGLSWEDVRDLFNKETGHKYGESKYRKYFTAFIEGMEYQKDKDVSSNEMLVELKKAKKELEIAKIQFQDQKREYKKYLRHEGRLRHLLQEMIDEFENEMSKKPLDWFNRVESNGSKQAGILLLSDLHNEMVTNNYWNTFNESVFLQRLNQVANECINYRSKHNLDELHIFALGDLIEGVLHRLTRINETENAVRATQRVAEKLSELVAVLANEYPKVTFRSVAGNHDRVSSRKEEEIRTESFHAFIPWYMKSRLSQFKNVEILDNEIDNEIIVADILGNTYFGVHGHLENLGKVVQDLTLMIKKFPIAIFSAHIHKNYEDEIHGIDLIVNGSFAGINDYAKDRRLTSKAHQKFIVVDEEGRKTTEYIRF